MAEHRESHHEGHDFAHPMPVWLLIAVFLALVFLTILTVALASIELGDFEIVTTLVIATIKAFLVMMFFMHLKDDKPFNAIVFFSSFLFVALFVGMTLLDSSAYQDELIPAVPAAEAPGS